MWATAGTTLGGLTRTGWLSGHIVLARLMESNRNGTCQQWASSVEGEKKKKKKSYFLTQRKFHQIPALPIHTLKLATKFLPHMTQALLKLLPLHWYLELVSLFMSP